MTLDDVLKMLASDCDRVGSQAAWALLHGVSQQYLNDVMRRRREPGPSILSRLGLERVVSYRRVR